MGKGAKATIGYWYHPAFMVCLHQGPMDALLQIRGGDYTAWDSGLTSSGSIQITADNLWGGEKAEGGINGALDIMFGDAFQTPNAAIDSLIAPDGSAHRGKVCVLFKGGRYGAMNPYPKPISFLTTRILKGWDDDDCWYPSKAQISLPIEGATLTDSSGNPLTFNLSPTFDSVSDPTFNYVNPGSLNLGTFHNVVIEILAGTSESSGFAQFDTVLIVNGEYFRVPDSASFPNVAAAGTVIWSGMVDGPLIIQVADKFPNPGGGFTFGFGAVGASGTIYIQSLTTANAMNPAHMLYDSLTANDMDNEPVANISDTSFRAAADRFYSEGFGLCTLYDPDAENIDQFRARISNAAGVSCTRSPIDGLWYLDVLRGGGDPSLLPILTDDDILDYEEDGVSLDDSVNQVAVQWFDPVMKQGRTTAPIQAIGSIESFQVINTQVNAYPEIPTEPLALRAAARDLATLSLPLARLTLTTNRKPYGWRSGTYFVLNAPKRGIASEVFLIGDINRGTLKSGAIQLKVVQDNYSLPSTTFVSPELGNSQTLQLSQPPMPVTLQLAFELPYAILAQNLTADQLTALDPSAGYLGVVGARPQSGTAGYDFDVSVGGGAYVSDGSGDWCPSASTAAAAGPFDGSVVVNGNADLQYIQIGTAAIWGSELVRIDAVDTGTNTVTMGRGCVDTIPVPQTLGSRLYFAGGFTTSDHVEYVSGEVVSAELLTRTPGAVLDSFLATPVSVTMAGRQGLPYPPAMVEVNGTRWDQVGSLSGTFTVTWAQRNRLSQGDQLVDQTAATITPETNTRYYLAFLDASSAVLVSRNDIGAATASVNLNYSGAVTMKLHAINDNGASIQEYSIPLSYSPGPGGGLSGAVIAGSDPAQGLFVIAVITGGPSYTYYDSPDGITWTVRITNDMSTTDFPQVSPTGKRLVGFIKVGSNWYSNKNGSASFWKSAGASWYTTPWAQTTGSGPSPQKVRFLNGAWVLWSATTFYTSTDFTTWSAAASPSGLAAHFVYSDLIWDATNSRYLLFGNVMNTATAYSAHLYRSTDLVNWTEITGFNGLLSNHSLMGDEFQSDIVVAADGAGNIAVTGLTGATLTTISLNDFLSAWTPFIAKSTNNGTTWTLASASFPTALTTPWNVPVPNQLDSPLDGALWDGSNFFVYAKGYFGRSADHGVTWTWTTAPANHHYTCCANGAGTVLFQGTGPSGLDAIGINQASGTSGGGLSGGSNSITATAYTPVFNGTIVDGGHA